MGLWAQIRDDMEWYRIVNRHPTRAGVLADRYFWIVANYRLGAWSCRRPATLGRLLGKALYFFTNFVISTVTGADIRSGAEVGRRFTVHTSRGLLITNGVRIGDGCSVNTGVCIVNRANDRGEGVPTIGNEVRIGVGAKILGGITVGDGVQVGANAVVIRDVPPGHLAVGVPAVHKPRRRAES